MIEPRIDVLPALSADFNERRRAEEAEHALIAEHAARREAEVSAERFQFLSEAGALLAASLDQDAVVANLAHLGVSMLAEWCAVDLVDATGHVARAALAAEDPRMFDAGGDDAATEYAELVGKVLDSGRSVLVAQSTHRFEGQRLCVPLIAQGRCLGAVLFVTTDTARRSFQPSDMALAEELARHAANALTNARLYAEVAEQEQSLRLSERMSAIGAVAAGVAHEVRNPLFGISSTLDALESTFPGRRDLEPFLGTLRHQVGRLGRLMSDLLEYGKPSLSERALCPLGDVLARGIAHCTPIAERAGVTVSPEFDCASLPAVAIDRERLVRVFQNLIENAIEHSATGDTVRVIAEVVDTEEGAVAECRVADEGAGIDAADLPRLFEPFFTRRHGGTGLGLSIVERIVIEHGGTVAAANGRDGGAVITIRLPVRDT